MNPFDELTLGEVDYLLTECIDGKSITEADPLKLAGGVMFMHEKRNNPELSWKTFMETTKMGAIKEFSSLINDDESDPTSGVSD